VARDVLGDLAPPVLVVDDAIRLLVVDVEQERIAEWRS
jgi:hypothetical protein